MTGEGSPPFLNRCSRSSQEAHGSIDNYNRQSPNATSKTRIQDSSSDKPDSRMSGSALSPFGSASRSRADDVFPLLRFWKSLTENASCFSNETSHECGGHAYRTSRGTLTSPVEGSSLTIRVISTAGCPRHLLALQSAWECSELVRTLLTT
jgi:hypothetical protein